MLQIKNFSKTYNGKKKAVDDLSLTIEQGDIYGFIGANGAGKTSTIKAVAGIHNFESGSIDICGHSIKKEPLLCKSMFAYIPDNPDLYEHLTGYQYINFIADLFQVSDTERTEKTKKYGELFEMTDSLGNIIASYSHGMKQRTAIISALVHSPKLLILDEPFVGLDPKAAFTLKQVMQELTADGGAIFFSTHVLDVAEKLCNKIAMLAGQITGLYPLSGFFLKGSNGITGIILFLVLSMAVLFLFVKIVAAKYSYFNALASTTSKYSKSRTPLKRHLPFIALYQKEFGRFFSSYMAVLNTGLGVLLLCIFSIFLLIMPPEQLGQYAGIEDMNGFLSDYAPIVVAAMLSLSCPAASSVSLEGKNVWILQSTPVSIRTVLNSKIAVNMTIHFFGYLLAVFAILTRLSMTTWQIISLICIPVCYSVFTAVLGVTLNKKYPCFDWDSEIMVVKQSIPVIVSGIVSMVFVAAPVLFYWFLSFPILPMLWITAGILITVSGIMYGKSCQSNYI